MVGDGERGGIVWFTNDSSSGLRLMGCLSPQAKMLKLKGHIKLTGRWEAQVGMPEGEIHVGTRLRPRSSLSWGQ